MPIQLDEDDSGKTLSIHFTGTLTTADYERLASEFERLVAQHGRLHVLFDMTGFHGWEAGALWDEIRFDIKHNADIERLAMVGNKNWQHGMAALFKPFTMATSRYFDAADAVEARKWLDEPSRSMPALGEQVQTQMIGQANTRADAAVLADTAQALAGGGKGLLAMDESIATCNKRFAAIGIPQTEEARRAYRELLVTAPGLGLHISGAILFDETIRQIDQHGTRFVDRLVAAGVIPGIKVDVGANDLALHPGETVTEGLDGLRGRLQDYARLGARFAKWRAVIAIGDHLPSLACIGANAHALARYAALCQEAGLVPIVEPEVLMTGRHTLHRSGVVTHAVLRTVFDALDAQGVALEAMILKPNMVLPGLDSPEQVGVDVVASATLACLQRTVPAAVAGIAFLSGGQSAELASARLNAINNWRGSSAGRSPWPLVFSFGRALQQPALQIWRGEEANVAAAQVALIHRATLNGAALRGSYTTSMEHEPARNMAS